MGWPATTTIATVTMATFALIAMTTAIIPLAMTIVTDND